MTETILLAAGGTGGHVFPGLATADALTQARPDLRVEFVGTADRIESRLVPEAGYTLHTVPAMAWSRTPNPQMLKLPVVLGRAVQQVKTLINGRTVIAAVGFGGYTSVSLALAAKLTGTPMVVHEQNAIAGMANKLAGRLAAVVAVSFAQAATAFGTTPTVVTGNPVRPDLMSKLGSAAGREVRAARMDARDQAAAVFGLRPDRRTLLIFGGSQGARRINDALTGSVGRWADPGALQILHATGHATHAATRAAWQDAGVDLDGRTDPDQLKVVCIEFIDRMDLAYAAADVVVCRAGASSIAELTALGIPAVLVPYPFATADHQTANARALADGGGAIAIADQDLDAQRLVQDVQPLLDDGEAHAQMQAAAVAFGRPNASTDLAEVILATVAGGRDNP